MLRPPVTLVQTDPAFDHSSTATFAVGAAYRKFDHIVARVRIRAFSRAVLNQLVASGDLDASLARPRRTLEIAGATRHWTKTTAIGATGCVADPYE